MACPPEDCGGVWGYSYLLEILADPAHEEHKERPEWLGLGSADEFDPATFDLAEINSALPDLATVLARGSRLAIHARQQASVRDAARVVKIQVALDGFPQLMLGITARPVMLPGASRDPGRSRAQRAGGQAQRQVRWPVAPAWRAGPAGDHASLGRSSKRPCGLDSQGTSSGGRLRTRAASTHSSGSAPSSTSPNTYASSRNGSSGGQFFTESHASARMRSFSTARR
jgi:pRiA4b ORF-3-like protein